MLHDYALSAPLNRNFGPVSVQPGPRNADDASQHILASHIAAFSAASMSVNGTMLSVPPPGFSFVPAGNVANFTTFAPPIATPNMLHATPVGFGPFYPPPHCFGGAFPNATAVVPDASRQPVFVEIGEESVAALPLSTIRISPEGASTPDDTFADMQISPADFLEAMTPRTVENLPDILRIALEDAFGSPIGQGHAAHTTTPVDFSESSPEGGTGLPAALRSALECVSSLPDEPVDLTEAQVDELLFGNGFFKFLTSDDDTPLLSIDEPDSSRSLNEDVSTDDVSADGSRHVLRPMRRSDYSDCF